MLSSICGTIGGTTPSPRCIRPTVILPPFPPLLLPALLLLRLSLLLNPQIPSRRLRLILTRDALPIAADPQLVLVAVPHVALLHAGGFEDVVLADGAVVNVWHGCLLVLISLICCWSGYLGIW
jgi:hypothetical protein